ncbi:MAG TPA: class I SAM-dependent methyltransferase [Polyangia bacterium]|jgi:ubiquinone/menaquinone biosynthesis C-methylase UbiE
MPHDHGPHEHGHRFDPAHLARLDSPARRERMPPAAVVAAVAPAPGVRLADIGAGTGYLLLPLLEAAQGQGAFHAVDISPVVLDELRRRLAAHPFGGAVQVLLGEEGRVPLAHESVDVVVLGAVLHEFASLAASLAEVRRVLAPGGRVVVADWDRRPEQHGAAEHGPPYEHRIPREQAEAALTAAGFTDLRRHEGFQDAYLLSARRA